MTFARSISAPGGAAGAPGNPFLPMAAPYRFAIVAYLLLYHLIFPVFAVGSDAGPLIVFRFLSEALLIGLTALPFLLLGKEGGWLHPLMLPGILRIAKEVFKDPMALLDPLSSPMVYLGARTYSRAVSLSLSDMELDLTRIGLTLTYCLALIVYYAAFFATRRFRWPRLPLAYGRNVPAWGLAMVAISIIAALLLFQTSGGLANYLVAMRGGRVALFAEIGPVLQVISFSTTVISIWMAYERRPFLNPFFVVAAVSSLFLTLVATGSRSSAVIPAVILLMLWWRQTGRVRLAPALGVIVLAYAIVGGFGLIRQDYGSQKIDLSAVQSGGVSSWFSAATSEGARRDMEESDLAAFAGANRFGLLWGQTYVYGASFWVPRGLWPDKPRSADSYNMWINYAGHPITEPLPRAGEAALFGIPVGQAVEAYWNFHIFGVLAISILMGLYARALTALAQQYAWIPAIMPVVVWFSLFGGTSKTFVGLMRDLAFTIPLLWAFGVLVLGRRTMKAPLALAARSAGR